MAHSAPMPWFADAMRPLGGAFGERLRFSHDGAGARWSYDGHDAVVEPRGTGRVVAYFIGPPALDAVSGQPSAPVYLREARGYPLTRAGCEHMVADMVAFFSGAREPHFTFVAAR